MKYTVEGFNQQFLLELGLDAIDAVILRWVADFIHTGKMKQCRIHGKTYYWIRYMAVLEDIPIINIHSPVVLRRRFLRYEAVGLMQSHLKNNRETYYRFLPGQYSKLITAPKLKSLSQEDSQLSKNTQDTESPKPKSLGQRQQPKLKSLGQHSSPKLKSLTIDPNTNKDPNTTLSPPTPSQKKEPDRRYAHDEREREFAAQQEKDHIYQECADLVQTTPNKIKKIQETHQLTLAAIRHGCQQAASDPALRNKAWWLSTPDAWYHGEYVPYGPLGSGQNGNGSNPALAWWYGLSKPEQQQLEQRITARFASILQPLSTDKRRNHQVFQQGLAEEYVRRNST